MEVYILDDTFQTIYNIDLFESLIWTERYNGCGNFELYTPMSEGIIEIVNLIQKKMKARLDCYAWIKESESVMIIEDLEIKTDSETGNHLIISGRGLESILERRIVWGQIQIRTSLQTGIQKLLNLSIINPTDKDRTISNFIFSKSTDNYIESLRMDAQYTGDNLYDVIYKLCDITNLGFDVDLDEENRFVFQLKNGKDRSYDQEENPYVIFSPKYENLVGSDYLESIKNLKNVTLVAGEDKGSSRKTRIVGSGKGMTRRELYTDARDIQSEVDDTVLTDSEYNALLDQRGKEKLSENIYIKAFTGEIEALKSFVYGEDYFKGDIVQIANEYGMESTVRVSEVVRVQDTNGYSVYPTFQIVE